MQLKLELDIDRIVVDDDDYEVISSRLTSVIIEEVEAEIRNRVRNQIRNDARLLGKVAELQGVVFDIFIGTARDYIEGKKEDVD